MTTLQYDLCYTLIIGVYLYAFAFKLGLAKLI